MIVESIVIGSAFLVAAGTAFLVLLRLEKKDYIAEIQSGLLQNTEETGKKSLKERLKELKEKLLAEKTDVNTETVYFLLLFLLNIQSGLSVASSLKRAYFSLASTGLRVTKYLKEIIAKVDSGLPFTQVVKVLDKFKEAHVLREALSGILQSSEFGTPVGESIKTALGSIQEKRVISAEAKASRVAVLLAFPVVFGFLPALLILVGYPALSQLLKILGGLTR